MYFNSNDVTEDFDHQLIHTAHRVAERITEDGHHSLSDVEPPEKLFEEFRYQYTGDTWDAVNEDVDGLAWAMGVCYALGFLAHDRGNLAASESYFFAKDLNMFAYPISEGVITPSDVLEGTKRYRELLDIKDALEWVALSDEAKRTVAADTYPDIHQVTGHEIDSYLDFTVTQIDDDLSERAKQALGVRDVDSTDFIIGREDWSDPWQPLAEHNDTRRLFEAKSIQRAQCLGLSEELYSEGWFTPHKTVDSYSEGCFAARYAELRGATLLDQFDQQAAVFRGDPGTQSKQTITEQTIKDSDGLKGPGSLALYYSIPVELHDEKSGIATRRIPHAVAPHLKATQLPRVYDGDIDCADVRNFGLSYRQSVDTAADSWEAFLAWCEGPDPISELMG